MTNTKMATRRHGSIVNPTTIDRGIAKKRVDYFSNAVNNKKDIIKSHLGGTEQTTLKFSLVAFLSLLETTLMIDGVKGLRVYFACYTKSNTGNQAIDTTNDKVRIPKGQEGFITLLFAPTYDDGTSDLTDTKDYYIMDAKGTYIISLDQSEAKRWVNEFVKTGGIWEDLSKNQVQLPNGDTKSLWYSVKSIQDTYDDIHLNHMNDTTEITVFLATYPPPPIGQQKESFDFGTYQGQQLWDVHNQLTVIFGTGDIPDEMAFHGLPSQKLERMVDPTDYDTAGPCPPAVGCLASTLP